MSDARLKNLAAAAWRIRRFALRMGEVQGQGYIGQLVPPDGVYAVRLVVGNAAFKAILNIKNSRYGEDRCKEAVTIEIFPFGVSESLAGKDATVYFAKFIRNEIKFDASGDLEKQLEKDKAMVEDMIY